MEDNNKALTVSGSGLPTGVMQQLAAALEEVANGVEEEAASLPPFVSLTYPGSNATRDGIAPGTFVYKSPDGGYVQLGRVMRAFPVFLGPNPFWGRDAHPPRKLWGKIGEGLICYSLNGEVPVFDGEERVPFMRPDPRLGGTDDAALAEINAYKDNRRAIENMARGFSVNVRVDETTSCKRCQFAQFVRVKRDGQWKTMPPLCNPEAHFLFAPLGGAFSYSNRVSAAQMPDILHLTAHKMALNFMLPNPYNRRVNEIVSSTSTGVKLTPLSELVKRGLIDKTEDGQVIIYPVLIFPVMSTATNTPFLVTAFAARLTHADALELAQEIWSDTISVLDGEQRSKALGSFAQLLMEMAAPIAVHEDVERVNRASQAFRDQDLANVLFSNPKSSEEDDVEGDVADELTLDEVFSGVGAVTVDAGERVLETTTPSDGAQNEAITVGADEAAPEVAVVGGGAQTVVATVAGGDTQTVAATVVVDDEGFVTTTSDIVSNEADDKPEGATEQKVPFLVKYNGFYFANSEWWGDRPTNYSGADANNPMVVPPNNDVFLNGEPVE